MIGKQKKVKKNRGREKNNLTREDDGSEMVKNQNEGRT